jgi:hypothetical protein
MSNGLDLELDLMIENGSLAVIPHGQNHLTTESGLHLMTEDENHLTREDGN